MPDSIAFTVKGRPFRLSQADVVGVMRGVEPGPIRAHGVFVAGQAYPVKQVFAAATGLDRLDFTSEVARRHLEHLGFELMRAEATR
ncbi:MAG: SCO5918 family protein [Acidimicrobiales bacterium]